MELGQLYNLPLKDIYYLYSTLLVTGLMTRQRVILVWNFECLIPQLVRLWLGCHEVAILVMFLCVRHLLQETVTLYVLVLNYYVPFSVLCR
jgi:hypothetical protein